MTKREIKKATDKQLIIELAKSYADVMLAYNIARLKTERVDKHLQDVLDEMLARGIFEQEDADRFS